MSYKPDESTLISYLYGELGETEREKVHRYLTDNPSALQAMQDLTVGAVQFGVAGRIFHQSPSFERMQMIHSSNMMHL